MNKKRKFIFRLIFILLLVLVAGVIVWPKGVTLKIPKAKISFSKSAPFIAINKNGYFVDKKINYQIKQGLDLQGGSHLVYKADLTKTEEKDKESAMESLRKVIENRVNAFGVSEPLVYTTKVGDENRLAVELAGIKDTAEAEKLIGKTAKLEFKEVKGNDFAATGLEGKDFKRAEVGFDQNGSTIINIEFNSEGAKKFAEITARNIGKPLAIYLDDQVISAPNVQNEITGGKAQITGKFTVKEAKDLAIQLNAGALPVEISKIEERTVGATLGQDSIYKSIVAAVIGIIFVSLFMIFYYRLLGIFSTIGLGLYVIFMLAIFKLFGIVLTMGGIAGLILSIGMSMETDVLVFERIREELRNGRSFVTAASLGFSKAWPSIRDSNVVSLIITAILYTAGGVVRGFAVALGLGIVVGLLTTFLGTRTIIDFIAQRRFSQKNWLYRVEEGATE